MFASAGMIYGVHIWSRRLIWPWFPCMITCILTSLAYCIMWWCGDVRDYWLAITIIEIIGVFINVRQFDLDEIWISCIIYCSNYFCDKFYNSKEIGRGLLQSLAFANFFLPLQNVLYLHLKFLPVFFTSLMLRKVIIVILQIYCVVVVLMYYRRLNATTDEYEGKDRMVRYKINRMGGHSSRRDLLESYGI